MTPTRVQSRRLRIEADFARFVYSEQLSKQKWAGIINHCFFAILVGDNYLYNEWNTIRVELYVSLWI